MSNLFTKEKKIHVRPKGGGLCIHCDEEQLVEKKGGAMGAFVSGLKRRKGGAFKGVEAFPICTCFYSGWGKKRRSILSKQQHYYIKVGEDEKRRAVAHPKTVTLDCLWPNKLHGKEGDGRRSRWITDPKGKEKGSRKPRGPSSPESKRKKGGGKKPDKEMGFRSFTFTQAKRGEERKSVESGQRRRLLWSESRAKRERASTGKNISSIDERTGRKKPRHTE